MLISPINLNQLRGATKAASKIVRFINERLKLPGNTSPNPAETTNFVRRLHDQFDELDKSSKKIFFTLDVEGVPTGPVLIDEVVLSPLIKQFRDAIKTLRYFVANLIKSPEGPNHVINEFARQIRANDDTYRSLVNIYRELMQKSIELDASIANFIDKWLESNNAATRARIEYCI